MKPLCFFRNDSKQRKQWLKSAGGRKVGWVAAGDDPHSSGNGAALLSCRTSPRSLESIAATARGSLGNESAKEKKRRDFRLILTVFWTFFRLMLAYFDAQKARPQGCRAAARVPAPAGLGRWSRKGGADSPATAL